MEYTTIQPDSVVDDLLIRNIDQADQAALGYRIDTGSCDFCMAIREIAGDPPDPALDEQKTNNSDRADAEVAKIADISNKLSDSHEDLRTKLDAARKGWLQNFIAAIEAEHVQHQALIDNASILGLDSEQVERSQIAQLVIEGAHISALAELTALGG